jgi:hypothetical protein
MWVIAIIVGVVLLVVPVPVFLLVRCKRRKSKAASARAAAEAEAARERMQTKFARPGSKSFSLKPGGGMGGGGGGGATDIMVSTGSVGGRQGYANNGRLQSWSSPNGGLGQYSNSNGLYGISRQTSVTSMASGMPVRAGSQPVGSLPAGDVLVGNSNLQSDTCRGCTCGIASQRLCGPCSDHCCAPLRPALPQSARGGYGLPQRVPSLPGLGRGPVPAMELPAGAYEEELEAARTARSERSARH